MSKSPLLEEDGSVEDLSDEELLKRIAALDPEKFPLARHAQRGLENIQEESS